MDKRIQWITRTALLIALLIVVQAVTKGFGQFVTGSLVNMILIVGGVVAGLFSGLTVAVVSPIFAYLLGISPQSFLIPFIIAGNVVIVLITTLLVNKSLTISGTVRYLYQAIAVAGGAVVKFAVLYFGIVKILLPSLTLKQPVVDKLTAAFSYPQLVTACIGGFISMVIIPVLKKAIK